MRDLCCYYYYRYYYYYYSYYYYCCCYYYCVCVGGGYLKVPFWTILGVLIGIYDGFWAKCQKMTDLGQSGVWVIDQNEGRV